MGTGDYENHAYSMEMSYNTVGGITRKNQLHTSKDQKQKKTSYDNVYSYGDDQPHAPIHIGKQAYTYDANGNQTGWTHDVSGQRRNIIWDEENRIRAISDNGANYHYTYDASGIRVLKGKNNGQSVYVNGEWKTGSGNMGNYTMYVNPYIVLKSGGYTKHYYIEEQRIVSKLGGGLDNNGKGPLKAGEGKVNYGKKHDELFEGIVRNLKFLAEDGTILTAGKSGKIPPGQVIGNGPGKGGTESFRYFYHPDHIGSTSYITDVLGEVYQHLEYFAFGETFVEEHSNTDRTPYLFNGKELDEETGLYYYGSRYYDSQKSIWLSVDLEAERSPGWSPFNYTFNNPINLIDPNGQFSISNHYEFTNNALSRLGYSDKSRDLISHYSSVYADHPAKWITYQQGQRYRKGIDYSGTAESQNTSAKENSSWHSMSADGEKITRSAAMKRGQAFGWGKVIEAGIEAGKNGGVGKFEEDSPGIQALGQGIHALQDAIAHQGTDMDNHDLINDMSPSKQDITKAENAAFNSIIVAEVIGGDYRNVKNGMSVDLTGTTTGQYNQIKGAFQKAVNTNDKVSKIFLIGKPED
jgi:RHS repeat-associated protein